ncbi:MAG: NIPSNAP family protein [Tannerellaceae bacterium]|jgi:hypothetical protein|nr:NIPSNAP family protein [Tannerellaceae bacterium]
MLRRNFIKTAGLLAAVPACGSLAANGAVPASGVKEIYEWRIYGLKGDGAALDDFYAKTLIPAYNRMGITVGAFAPEMAGETLQRYFLFIYPNLATYHEVKLKLWDDKAFREAAQAFYDSSAAAPVYSEFVSYLCEAFDKVPRMLKPDKSRTLFEWRNYKSPNEEANRRKVKMFNSGEIDVFDAAGINSVCYGEVLAGPRMPSLVYLTWHKDKATRDEAWKKFGGHPEWQRMRNLDEYKYTATDNQVVLLTPLAYSQI